MFIVGAVVYVLVIGAIVGPLIAITLFYFFYKGIREERTNYVLSYLVIYWILINAIGIFILFHIFHLKRYVSNKQYSHFYQLIRVPSFIGYQ